MIKKFFKIIRFFIITVGFLLVIILLYIRVFSTSIKENKEILSAQGESYLSEIKQEEYYGYDLEFAMPQKKYSTTIGGRSKNSKTHDLRYCFVDFDRQIQTIFTETFETVDGNYWGKLINTSFVTSKISGSREDGWTVTYKNSGKVAEYSLYISENGQECVHIEESPFTYDYYVGNLENRNADFIDAINNLPLDKIPEAFALNQ